MKKKNKRSITAAIALTVAISVVTGPSAAVHAQDRAAEGIAVDERNFPDAVFREYVNSFDQDGNGVLDNEEINKAAIVSVTDGKIKSVEGVEYFSNLQILIVDGTSISSLDVSQNKNLYQLQCSQTQITSLELKDHPSLENVYCNNNPVLDSLDISGAASLKELNCSNTALSIIDVSKNKRLETLNCSRVSKLTELDLSQNPELLVLKCNDTGMKSLSVDQNGKLRELNCSGLAELKELDVRQNPNLQTLDCSGIGISSLDVSKNPLLKNLICQKNAEITSVDLKDNPKLETLSLALTNIMDLDISNNPLLRQLNCNFTKVTALDVSNNHNLEELYCNSDHLAWMDIGNSTTIRTFSITPPAINIGITSETFDITEMFPGIDASRVRIISGAGLNSQIVSGYTQGIPIVYEYDCGTLNDVPKTLTVQLNLSIQKQDSSIVIGKSLDTTFTGNPVELTEADCVITGSDGKVMFGYFEKLPDGSWKSLDTAPKNAGTYKVTVAVEESTYYNGTQSEREFTIAKAKAPVVTLPAQLSGMQDAKLSSIMLYDGWYWVDGSQTITVHNEGYQARLDVDDKNYDYSSIAGYNHTEHYIERTLGVTVSQGQNEWSVEPSIEDWVYGETAKEAAGCALHGTVTFTYCDSETGVFQAGAPADAGIWYMKASVPASDEYTGLDKIVKFTIHKAVPVYQIPKDLKAVYGQLLEEIVLPDGFAWTDQRLSAGDVGENSFTLIFTPEDMDNYEEVRDIKVTVTVAKAENAVTTALTLSGWTYGSAPNTPSAGFRYGTPRYLYCNKLDGKFTETIPETAGTWYVKAVAEGTKNYTAKESAVVTFVIAPKNAGSDSQISVPDISADTDLDSLIIKDGEKTLVQGTDYDITKKQEENKVTVTISFKGNYTGIVTKTYTTKNEIDKIFIDVEAHDWFAEDVQYVYDNGYMTGLSENVFGPETALSRAHLATILHRMEGRTDVAYSETFPDVLPDQFYTNPVIWASSKEVGVIAGYENGNFGPADIITREQFATMMYRYAKFKRYDTKAADDLKAFPDAGTVSPFALDAVKWAVAEGLIEGDNGNINPQGEANRAECAAIIYRFMENVAK